MTVEIEHEVAVRLRAAAAECGTTVPALAGQIIDTVAADKLVDAVLDDRPATR
jgi:hypothetical protein